MKEIESSSPITDDRTTSEIEAFWTRNINAERIMGKDVTTHRRGEEQYFKDIEAQRYRSHRHLLPWITAMQPGKSVLEIGCGIGIDSYTMATHGMRLTAIDLTEVGIQTVRQRFADNNLGGEFSVGDACDHALSSSFTERAGRPHYPNTLRGQERAVPHRSTLHQG